MSGTFPEPDRCNRKKQGPWMKKYPNGNLMYEGKFKNDKPVGLFKRYTEEGVLLSELTYADGIEEAERQQYSFTLTAQGQLKENT
ncbi:MAG: hypothetical protein R2758_08925 [Bacteroidales bacterium]